MKTPSSLALVAQLVALVSLTHPAAADNITFDPDGAGANPAQQISGFDFAPGNALARGAVPFTVGSTFQLYQQMTLSALLNTSGNPVVPAGLNTSFELTVVASITYTITSVSAMGSTMTVTAAAAPVQAAASFLEIYYSAANSNALPGVGYNDGTLILSGRPTSFGSVTFVEQRNANGSSQLTNFDQFGTNNYPGVMTITAAGSGFGVADVLARNPAFFISEVQSMRLDTAFETPFDATDPSASFAAGASAVSPNRGSINGSQIGGGQDFQLQTDGTATFVIPEPSSAVLLSLALLAGAAVTFRRRCITRAGSRAD